MIKESICDTTPKDIRVTKVCDECHKEDQTTLRSVLRGRDRRKAEIDLCVKCSNSSKYRYTAFAKKGAESIKWKGGRYLSQCGNKSYYKLRIDGKTVYEHVFVYEQHIGRKLIGEECIHHIDMDSLNNNVENLYLCKNKTVHHNCHVSAEDCGRGLLGLNVWFDRKSQIYTLNKVEDYNGIDVDLSEYAHASKYKQTEYRRKCNRNARVYWLIDFGQGRRRFEHSLIAEKVLGRKLFRCESVHHIDMNTLNNNTSNLIVLTAGDHKRAHKSLERCVSELYRNRVVSFVEGEYRA